MCVKFPTVIHFESCANVTCVSNIPRSTTVGFVRIIDHSLRYELCVIVMASIITVWTQRD